jgi:hypothetical protein
MYQAFHAYEAWKSSEIGTVRHCYYLDNLNTDKIYAQYHSTGIGSEGLQQETNIQSFHGYLIPIFHDYHNKGCYRFDFSYSCEISERILGAELSLTRVHKRQATA